MLIYGSWRCAECNRDTFTASIKDPERCTECARTRYAWHPAPFGRARKVPPLEAARWDKPAIRTTAIRPKCVARRRLNAA